MNPKQPVNEKVHEMLTSEGYKFLESKWENEFAISRYQSPGGTRVLKVEQKGTMFWE